MRIARAPGDPKLWDALATSRSERGDAEGELAARLMQERAVLGAPVPPLDPAPFAAAGVRIEDALCGLLARLRQGSALGWCPGSLEARIASEGLLEALAGAGGCILDLEGVSEGCPSRGMLEEAWERLAPFACEGKPRRQLPWSGWWMEPRGQGKAAWAGGMTYALGQGAVPWA